jgi:hypothetical protein
VYTWPELQDGIPAKGYAQSKKNTFRNMKRGSPETGLYNLCPQVIRRLLPIPPPLVFLLSSKAAGQGLLNPLDLLSFVFRTLQKRIIKQPFNVNASLLELT